jgi:hypothetical protein
LKEVVAPLEGGEEKTYYHQQHWVSLLKIKKRKEKKDYLIYFLKTTLIMGWC